MKRQTSIKHKKTNKYKNKDKQTAAATAVSSKNKIEETKKKCAVALRAYKRCGTITKSAKTAGIAPSTLRRYLEIYPKFAKRWNEAYEEYLDDLESIADYRARAYSDKLLQFLLTGGRKGKYGNVTNVTATATAKIEPESILTLANEMAKRMDNKIRHNIPVIDAEYRVVDNNG